MYTSQSFKEKVVTNEHGEDHDLCNTEPVHKFIVQWSPQNGVHYLSRNRYAMPRSLSKSVPRRNRGITCYNINRSLNFDSGTRGRTQSFKLSNSSPDSNVPVENDNYLSRSAKILRALNINYSPLKNPRSGTCRVNKSLNFHLSPSPSPNGSASVNKSVSTEFFQTMISPVSKINKTLNFETSSSGSSVNSRPDSSVESIDENQNQTPSQRNRKAKKSLNYPSPKFGSPNLSSNDSIQSPPMLRSELREKITNIIQSNMTPKLHSSKRNLMKDNHNRDFGANTSRNLFNDFDDDEGTNEVIDDRDTVRPGTPENVMKMVPESMSAIKKSHKKERTLGRLGKALGYQSEIGSGREFLIDVEIKAKKSRLPSPGINKTPGESPTYVGSAVDRPLRGNHSKHNLDFLDDDMSDTGSLFDYSNERNTLSEDSFNSDKNVPRTNISEHQNSSVSEEEHEANDSFLGNTVSNNNETRKPPEDRTNRVASRVLDLRDANKFDVAKEADDEKKLDVVQGTNTSDENLVTARTDDISITESTTNTGTSEKPGTPENRVNLLQHIMTDSIKKSHKKIKETKKKLFFKPRNINADAQRESNTLINLENGATVNDDRAATPENTNSSRLLLSQFSSVKKSHRKDKHTRMVSDSLRRKKFFDHEGAPNLNCEPDDCANVSPTSDSPGESPPRIFSHGAKFPAASYKRSNKTAAKESSSPDSSGDFHYHSLEICPLDNDTSETGIDALPNVEFRKLSPNKRKNVSDDSLASAICQSPPDRSSLSMSYESAEEEFKIFTPIKKRKSLNSAAPIARRICDGDDDEDNFSPKLCELAEKRLVDNNTTRCSTPTTTRCEVLGLKDKSFETPDRCTSTVTDDSTPDLRETENADGSGHGGRTTPQNQSTTALMVGINSIKKSHKKDKRGHASRIFVASAGEKENEFASSFENDSSKSSQLSDGPRPSCSYEITSDCSPIELGNETATCAKTPPNCLQVKNYLKQLQTESIKRSHKKVRERRNYRSNLADSELSDDGSIFNAAQHSINAKRADSEELENGRVKNADEICARDCGTVTSRVGTSPEKNKE